MSSPGGYPKIRLGSNRAKCEDEELSKDGWAQIVEEEGEEEGEGDGRREEGDKAAYERVPDRHAEWCFQHHRAPLGESLPSAFVSTRGIRTPRGLLCFQPAPLCPHRWNHPRGRSAQPLTLPLPPPVLPHPPRPADHRNPSADDGPLGAHNADQDSTELRYVERKKRGRGEELMWVHYSNQQCTVPSSSAACSQETRKTNAIRTRQSREWVH